MIFDAQVVQTQGINVLRLTDSNDFFGVGYNSSKEIVLMTVWNEEGERKGAILGGSVVDTNPTNIQGFGSSVESGEYAQAYTDLQQEIQNRNLIYP